MAAGASFNCLPWDADHVNQEAEKGGGLDAATLHHSSLQLQLPHVAVADLRSCHLDR